MDRRSVMKAAVAGGIILCAQRFAAESEIGDGKFIRSRLAWTHDNETLSLVMTRQPSEGPVVLYVHGATFPTALSVGWRMGRSSWLDHLQTNGFDAWSLDFAGYGWSDRPSVFDRSPNSGPPYGDHRAAAEQILAALAHIQQERPGTPIHVIAHSWGTIPARWAAIKRRDLVSSLILFGPVVTRNAGSTSHSVDTAAYWLMTADQQKPRQRKGVPDHLPTPVSDAELDRWCAAFLDSDPSSRTRTPASNKIPNGPIADLENEWRGVSLIDNALITQPTMIIRGEWDDVTTDADASRLFGELTNAVEKRDVKISGGNHWLHLQPRRTALWAETVSFLGEQRRR